MASAWTIVEYTGRDGLMQLEADWTRLVGEMPDASFQHLHETHLSALEHLPSKFGTLTCLALSDGTRVRAICPIDPQRIAVFRFFKSPVWGFLKGLEDVPRDVICPPDPEAEAALFPSVVAHLARTRRGGRWIAPTRVIEGSATWRCLRRFDAARYYADPDGAAHIIDCDRPFAGITERLSRKFRANLRSAHNRLAKLPDVRFVRIADAAGLEAAFERYLRVEASGWKGGGGSRTAISLRPSKLAFYRSWIAALGSFGRCEFNELRSGETCLASTFCLCVGKECTVLNISYDERYANVAPGHLVLERILQQCCENPAITRVNLVGNASWNLVWQPELVGSFNVYVGVGGWAARARVALLRSMFRYWPIVKRWLPAFLPAQPVIFRARTPGPHHSKGPLA
jgi:hypothetical protein